MSNNTVFITGCSSGVGLAAAKHYYHQGWNVVATMRSPEKDTELSQLNKERLLLLKLDVQDIEGIKKTIDTTILRFGRIDVLVNNAGMAQNGLFEMLSKEAIQEQFNINVFGPMETIRAILPHFRSNKGGVIVNTSSGAGFFSTPILSIYTATKHALEGFTESVSYELASQNIQIKSIVPVNGISGTNFNRSASSMLNLDPHLAPSYGEYMGKLGQLFGGMLHMKGAPASEVAAAIYNASTDGTNKLRYFVGETDEMPFMKFFYESNTDEEYMSKMRPCFP